MNSYDVADVLAEDHAEVGAIFGELYDALEEGDNASAFKLLDTLWARLAVHIRAEHLRLFPAISRALEADSSEDAPRRRKEFSETSARLRSDHDFFMHEIARAVNIMRAVSASPADRLSSESLDKARHDVEVVEARLESHNRLEEEQIYKLPSLIMTAQARSRLVAQVRAEIENLPPRFSVD